jgi:hypothetical protein
MISIIGVCWEPTVIRDTKYCEICVQLVNGARVRGRFHIDAVTSSTIRPSDALRELKSDFFILSHATRETEAHPPVTMMIRSSAIALVELPDRNWTTG